MKLLKAVAAGAAGALAILTAASPASALLRSGPYVPARYHCVTYAGHGYHRCSGGYGSNDNPNWGDYRRPSNASDCPRPHSHTGYPYGSNCDRQQSPGNSGGPPPEAPRGS